MKIKETLQNILNYYASTRRVGHTTAMIRGAQNVDNALVVTSNLSASRALEHNYPHIKTTSIQSGQKLLGFNSPILFDNEALYVLFRDALKTIEDLENKLNDTNVVRLGFIKNRYEPHNRIEWPDDIWTNSKYRMRLDQTGEWKRISSCYDFIAANVIELGLYIENI